MRGRGRYSIAAPGGWRDRGRVRRRLGEGRKAEKLALPFDDYAVTP
jgi:hypothetical protein